MRNRLPFVLAMVAATLLAPSHASGRDPAPAAPSADPLAPFERFIGGQWHLDGSYQELSWGVGRRSVRALSYFVVDGQPKLVGEGSWYWHPGEERIKGVFTAVDMPVVLFDYTARFEDGKMVSDLSAYDANGNESVFVETWELDPEGNRVWKLFQETPDGPREVMGGTYVRKAAVQHQHEAAADSHSIVLSAELAALLSEEMLAIDEGIATLVAAMAAGEWHAVAETAEKIEKSYILAQRLTAEQREELERSLPPRFKALDATFHGAAGKLARAASERDAELAVFHSNKLMEACVECHATYASERFPGFDEGEEGHRHD